MKRGKNAGNRIMAVVLLMALLIMPVPGNVQFVLAENTPEELGYTTDVTGLNVWENVWLKESVTIAEDVVVTGDVRMDEGVSIHITSGQFIVEGQATIRGDIYIEESGISDIWGTVNGTVYVNSTESSVQIEDWDGSLVRARNFVAYNTSYIENIVLNGVGTGYIDGMVDKLEVTENYNGDYGAEWNSIVREFEYYGSADFYNCGHMYKAYVTGGKHFSNNSGATIDCIVVSDGFMDNYGLIHFAILEKSGRMSNANIGETQWNEAMMEHLVIRENAEELLINGELYRNLENNGNIKSLIAHGGDIVTLGDVDYLYADGCRNLYIETCSWRMDRGTDYQVEYLYAKNTAVSVQDWTDDRTQKPYIRKARVENGNLNLADAKIEELYLEGNFTGITLDRVELYELYLETFELTEQTNIQLSNPEEVIIVDFGASSGVKDAFDRIMAEYSNQMSEEDKALLMDFMFEVQDISPAGSSVTEKDFTKTINQYDLITIEFSAASAVSAVVVESPSGYEFVVMSKNETTAESFMAYESGEYRFRVIGEEYGGNLQVEISKAAKLDMTVYTQYATENPDTAEKEKDTLEEYHVSIFDLTTGKEVTGFITEGEQVLFQENPRGHEFAMTLTSITESWEWEEVTVEFTLNEGETKQLEVVMKQFGDYFGYTKDGTVPQVYLYDAKGKFVRRCDTDSYGNFWAGRLPSGAYTAILLRDDTGNYMFSDLEDYYDYGLKEKEDYLKDVFTLEAGLNIFYPDVALTDAPSVENLYFDTAVTAVNTNRQTTVADELIQLTLDYTLREEYAALVSGLMFHFDMSEETEFKEGSVTLNGETVTDYELEEGCLIVPAEGASGSICFQISSKETDVTLLTKVTASFVLKGKEVKQFIGITSTYITALTASMPTVSSDGSIWITGYTSPDNSVSILDNGTVIGEVTSNASGYFNTLVTLPENISNHKVCVAKELGTASEIRTEEQIVTVMKSVPELLEFNMYYYVHGHSAKFHLNGDEFSSKRFIYDYWPGSVFTFEIKMEDSNRIDTMYVVSNNGSVKKLEAFYDQTEDIWVASGIFSEDENYAPADFDIEYSLKTISIDELGDYDMEEDKVREELLEYAYEKAEASVEDTNYDEETNTISATVNVTSAELGMNYSADVSMSYHKAERTPESLLEQGFLCENIDGIDTFYKHELDLETGKVTMTTVMFLTEKQETAMLEDELVLFGTIADAISDIKGELEQTVEVNVEDALYDWIRDSLGGEDGLPQALVDYLDEQDFAHQPLDVAYDFLDNLEEIGGEIDDWTETLTGKEANEERDKYFDKLEELERQLDQMLQAQMSGEAKECGMIPLDAFYDDLMACYESANNIANAKWSFGMIRKICSSAAGYVVNNGTFKYKGKDVDLADLLEIPTIEETGFDFIDNSALVTNINNTIEKANEYLDVENLFEKGIDLLAGDTMDYWDNSNAAHIAQLERNINELLLRSNTPIGPNAPVIDGGSTGGCFPPNVPGPDVTIPGGGGGVNWDPSGYVYEGVPSNRLDGVTATTYFRDENGNAVQWDAEEYGQINPQVTDAQGCYGWFVPEGDWKVVYTKEGYEIAETEWLPVPPPQTEVNVGLIATTAPELGYVVVSPSEVIISFSKYIVLNSISESRVYVKDTSGKFLSGTLEVINGEMGTDGTMLGSKFKIELGEQVVAGNTYTVVVKDGILGYNGLTVAETERSAVCYIRPESISVEAADYVSVGDESIIKIKVTADGGFESMALECVTDSKFLEVVSVGKISEDGTAELVVKGKKAGVSLLEVRVAGSDVVLEQDVVVASEHDAGLMRYVEKQKNQAAPVETPEEVPASNSIALWIALAVMILGVMTIIRFFVQKNIKKQSNL